MKQVVLKSAFWLIMVVFGMIAIGCSSDSGKLLKEVSGVWARD